MKSFSIFGLGALSLLIATGCAHDIRHATAHRSMDISGGQTPTGTVDFYAVSNKAVVPIYRVDKDGNSELLSAVGLAPGDSYDYDRSQTVVTKRLTVTAPTGTQQFLIDQEGPGIKAPVAEGKITPVAIHYTLLEKGLTFVIYTADADVQPPGDQPAK